LLSNRQKEVPKLSLLVAELEQLKQEFGNIDHDSEHNSISVVTEPITLDDVYLGPFKIELHLDKLKDLYQDSPHFCIALDPHPAATSEEVTHPHVSSEKLCEGEGAAAIRAALEEGRLCDFFTMIRSILNTYSPDSPYIALHDWDGTGMENPAMTVAMSLIVRTATTVVFATTATAKNAPHTAVCAMKLSV
jgi:hypothetical protein